MPDASAASSSRPGQASRSKQGRAFANRFSRDWSLLKEEKERRCDYPGRDREHYERAEMMIVRLSAPWTFVFHASEPICLVAGSPRASTGYSRKIARVFPEAPASANFIFG